MAKRVRWIIKKKDGSEERGMAIEGGITVAQDGKKLVFRKERKGRD